MFYIKYVKEVYHSLQYIEVLISNVHLKAVNIYTVIHI